MTDRPRSRSYRKAAVDDDVLTLARQRIANVFDQFDTVCVSFSGGKDSTVCLNLAVDEAERRGRLPLLVLSFDEEAIPLETEDYMRRVAADPRLDFKWLCLPIRHRNACSRTSPVWFPWAPEDEDLWVRPLPPEALTSFGAWPVDPPETRVSIPDGAHLLFNPRQHGRTCMLMGIRTDESLTRLRALLRKVEENYIFPHYPGGADRAWLWKAYPIYDWSTEDVWRAPKLLGWDTNEAYDRMELAGIPWPAQRCAPPYGEQPMLSLWKFKVCYPEIWDRMSRRVPGAATAARYANTNVYGIGRAVDAKSREEWQDRIAAALDRHPEGAKQDVTKRVAWWARNHYTHTTDPILSVAHPTTGVSWRFLLKVAERGDFKDRMNPLSSLSTEDLRASARRKYEAERARIESEASGMSGDDLVV